VTTARVRATALDRFATLHQLRTSLEATMMTPALRPRSARAVVALTVFVTCMLVGLSSFAQDSEGAASTRGGGGPTSLAGALLDPAASQAVGTVDLSTGAGRASIPFKLPTARGKAQPTLALMYDSNAGLGFAGQGWTLDLPAITRGTGAGFPRFIDRAPSDPNGDQFTFGGQQLVAVCTVSGTSTCTGLAAGEQLPANLQGWTYFRTQVDNFSRFFWSPDHRTWRVQSQSGIELVFGVPLDGTIDESGLERDDSMPMVGSNTNVYEWLLVRQTDASGANPIVYKWQALQSSAPLSAAPGVRYLTDIYATPTNEMRASTPPSGFAQHVHLTWDGVTDPVRIQTPVWRHVPLYHLTGIDVTSKPITTSAQRKVVRRYHLKYSTDAMGGRALLTRFDVEGACGALEDVQTGLLPPVTTCASLPGAIFDYTNPDIAPAIAFSDTDGSFGAPWTSGPDLKMTSATLVSDASPSFLLGPLYTNVNYVRISRLMGRRFDYLPKPATNGSILGSMGVNSDLWGLEDRTAPNTRIAALEDIVPGAPHAILGDWFGDTNVNILWLNDKNNTYEAYSADRTSSKLVGGGPFYLPAIFTQPNVKANWSSGKALDIDGDGLTDMALIPSLSGLQVRRTSFFSQKDRLGNVQPFSRNTTATCYPDTSTLGGVTVGGIARSFADMDGDGLADVVIVQTMPASAAHPNETMVRFWKNRGDGRFGLDIGTTSGGCFNGASGEAQLSLGVTGAVLSDQRVAVHDVTGDGLPDVLILRDRPGTDPVIDVYVQTKVDLTGKGLSFRLSGSVRTADGIDPYSNGPRQAVASDSVTMMFADFEGIGVDDVVVRGIAKDKLGSFNSYINIFGMTKHTRPSMLQLIQSDAGATTEFVYKPALSMGIHMPEQRELVTKITVSNGGQASKLVGGAIRQVTNYSYSQPMYDARDRAFLGFRSVVSSQTDSSSTPGVFTTTTFADATCHGVPAIPCGHALDYGYRLQRGLPYLVEQRDGSPTGKLLGVAVTSYTYTQAYAGIDGQNSYHVYPSKSEVYMIDPLATPSTSSTPVQVLTQVEGAFNQTQSAPIPTVDGTNVVLLRKRRVEDAFGNESISADEGAVGQDQPIVVANAWRLPPGDPTAWNYQSVSRTVSYYDRNLQGPVGDVRELDFTYDAQGNTVSVSAPLTGTLALDRRTVTSGAIVASPPVDASRDVPSVLLASMEYDSMGNLTLTKRPNNRCSHIYYDRDYGQMPVASAVGGCDGSKILASTYVYDRGFERIAESYTPGRAKTSVIYDAFGRVIEMYQPDASVAMQTSALAAVKVDYSEALSGIIKVSKIDSAEGAPASYRETYSYYDKLGNPLYTLAESETANTWNVQGAHLLTETGLLFKSYKPFQVVGRTIPDTALAAVGFRQYSYDSIGRVVGVYDLDANQRQSTKNVYHPLSIDTSDAEQVLVGGKHAGSFTTLVNDGHGRRIRTVQHLVNDPKDIVTTQVKYLASGELTSIFKSHTAGADNYYRWAKYDSLGRMVVNVEPNTSTNPSILPDVVTAGLKAWRYAYNDNGDLVGTSDARGCGENLAYDVLGRLSEEDFSPCESWHPTYTPAVAEGGEGTEVFYRYDVPEVGDVSGPYVGRVTAVYDRGAHTQFAYDGRGRLKTLRRQMGAPGSEGLPIASRYASSWFRKDFQTYDEGNRLIRATTGADAPELLGNGSWVSVGMSPRGNVASVNSSYGALVTNQAFNLDGQMSSQTLGDAAHTRTDIAYWPTGRMKALTVARTAGPWASAGPNYTPSTGSGTLQAELMNLAFDSDAVGNPTTIDDKAAAAGWAVGMQPAARTMGYDDAYRLRSVDAKYGAGDDPFKFPPLAPELKQGKGDNFPAQGVRPNRLRWQKFDYDWLGNTTSSTDDAALFGDRSLGTITNGVTGPNRLDKATAGASSLATTFDAAGNCTGYVTTQAACGTSGPCSTTYMFMWDEVGRLAQAAHLGGINTNGFVAAEFSYDAAGNRVRKGIWDATGIRHTVNVFDSLRLDSSSYHLGDYDHTAAEERVFLNAGGTNLGDVFFAMENIGASTSGRVNVFLALNDHLGSSSIVIDKDTSELVERMTFQAYGAAESDYRTERWANYREAYRFNGQDDDAEFGIVAMGQRFYSSQLGRWLSPDPLTLHQMGADLNPYRFGAGSPLRFADPSGLDGCEGGGCDYWGNSVWSTVFAVYNALQNVKFSSAPASSSPDKIPSAAPRAAIAPRGPVYATVATVWNIGVKTALAPAQFVAKYTANMPDYDGVGDFTVVTEQQAKLMQLQENLSMPPATDPGSAQWGRTLDKDLMIASMGTGFKAGSSTVLLAESRQVPMAFAASEVHPMLPEFTGSPARGVLEIDGESVFLQSGKEGPAAAMPRGSAGFDRYTRAHVEGHAIAKMIETGATSGKLILNFPGGPCPACLKQLPHMLPSGYTLEIVAPQFNATFFGWK
jgi:RHS repeat-associated protein